MILNLSYRNTLYKKYLIFSVKIEALTIKIQG